MHRKLLTKNKDGTLLFEIKLCAIFCRMITLNYEKYYKVYVHNGESFLYSHQHCKPMKPHVELVRRMLK